MPIAFTQVEEHGPARVLRLRSEDGTNRLTLDRVFCLIEGVRHLAKKAEPLLIAGNERFFSVGADLKEISALGGPEALRFSKAGQDLTYEIENFPAPVHAAISGYCMGGGLDLALACRRRIASPHAIFGHRGAALGLITGWGGTQRLPRLIGRGRALQMFVAAEKIGAEQALHMGLVDALASDPVAFVLQQITGDAQNLRSEARWIAPSDPAGIP